MNEFSHDSITYEFTLIVLPNSNPKPIVLSAPPDFIIPVSQFFNYTLSLSTFLDIEHNYHPALYMISSWDWLKFNSLNRTISGIPKQIGVYRVDIGFRDDMGLEAYVNFKITVVPNDENKLKYLWLYILSA